MIEPLTDRQRKWVDDTLASLTLREKIGQTAQERFGGFPDASPDALQEFFSENPLGSLFCGGEIIKGAGNRAKEIRDGLALCQRASKVPLLVAGDLESGAGSAVEDLTPFPQMMALGAANDENLAFEYGKFTAIEGRSAGFTWTFAPVADLLQNWLNPVVSNRCLGDQPENVELLVNAVIRGLQSHGVAACVKHFPGDGVDFRDQHLVTSANSLAEDEWWSNHGRVFQSAIDHGVYTVMTGHIALPWLEPFAKDQRRIRPATVSHRIVTELLRNRMGFEGVIVSDALEMAGFTGWGPYESRIVEAFVAGNDVMLWPGKNYFSAMERALMDGRIAPERLDQSVRRILTLKARLGLWDSEERDPLPAGIHAQAQLLANQVAGRSITLVRNRDSQLPLDAQKVKRLLLHLAVNPVPGWKDSLDVLKECLIGRGIELTVLENGNCLDVLNREASGERWDAWIVVFSLQIHQMKNTVRPVGPMAEVMWTLQNAETVHPIVVSLGTPFLLRDMPFLDTLINAYSPSRATAQALVRCLFGEADFARFSPVDVGGDWI